MFNKNDISTDINTTIITSDEGVFDSLRLKGDDGEEDRIRYTTNKDNLSGISGSEILITKAYFDTHGGGGGGGGSWPTDITSTSITNTNTTNDAVIHSNIYESDEVVNGSLKYRPVIKKGNLLLGDFTKEAGNADNKRGNIINVNNRALSTSYSIEQSILFGENIYVQSSFYRSLLIGSYIYNSGSNNLIVGYNCTGNTDFNTLLGEGLYTTSSKHYNYGAFLFGKFNTTNKFRTSESSVCIFDVAGGGTSSARKSLFEIYRNGNTYLNGYFESKGICLTGEDTTMTSALKPLKYSTNYTGTKESGDDDSNVIATKKYCDDKFDGVETYTDNKFIDAKTYADSKLIESKTYTDEQIASIEISGGDPDPVFSTIQFNDESLSIAGTTNKTSLAGADKKRVLMTLDYYDNQKDKTFDTIKFSADNTGANNNVIYGSWGQNEFNKIDAYTTSTTGLRAKNYLLRGDFALSMTREIDIWEGVDGNSGWGLKLAKWVWSDVSPAGYRLDNDSWMLYRSQNVCRIYYNTIQNIFVIEGIFEKKYNWDVDFGATQNYQIGIVDYDPITLINADGESKNVLFRFDNGHTREVNDGLGYDVGTIHFYGYDDSQAGRVISDRDLIIRRVYDLGSYHTWFYNKSYEGYRAPYGAFKLHDQTFRMVLYAGLKFD